jgi:MoaA/NifB/PqqE/SkfB family radical SAM enzyme
MRKLSLLKALSFKNLPLYLHYGITHRCNLRCRMCEIWSTAAREEELSLPRIQAMAALFSKLGTSVVSLGGGEPALREDLPEIVQAFANGGMEVRVLTNGVWDDPASLFNPCFQKGLKHISLSLDTIRPELQDEICRHPGAWNKALKSLEYFAGKLKVSRGIGLINTVISRLNYKELPEIVKLAKTQGFYVSFVPLEIQEFEGQVLSCKEYMPEFLFQEQDLPELQEVILRLIALKKQGEPIFNSSYFLRQLIPYFRGEKVQWPCLAGRLYFSVDPQGYLSLCHKYKGFSLQAENINAWEEGAWSKPDAGFLKACREVSEACRKTGGCLRPCWAEVSLSLTRLSSFLEMVKLQTLRPR